VLFIVATDLTVRVAATELLCVVAEEWHFDDLASLAQIARNALGNAIADTAEPLLTATVRLPTLDPLDRLLSDAVQPRFVRIFVADFSTL
jgi:hypothetical protein